MKGRFTPTGPFANPAFRRLAGGWTIGNIADSALFLTLAIWAKALSGSSGAAGLVFLALGAPVLLSPLLGHLSDRVRRKPLLIAGNLIAAGAVLTLTTIDGAEDLWLLYVVTFVYGTLGHLNSAAQSGLVRDLLPDDQLGTANATFSSVDQGMRVFTPLVGAALFVVWGGGGLSVAVACCLVVTALVLTTVHVVESEIEAPASDSFWRETAAGFVHIRTIPLLSRMLLLTAIAFGVVGIFDSALFEVVDKGLGKDAEYFGVLMSVQGGGSILGGVSSAWVLRRLGPAKALGAGLAMLGLAGVLMSVGFLPVPLLPFVLAGCALAGVGIPWAIVALVTTRQRLTPSRLQGRTAAAANMGISVPQLVSIAGGAALVGVVDYRVLMVAAGAIMLVAAASLAGMREPAEAREAQLEVAEPAA